MLIDPYTYVRTITLGLATLWTIGAAIRVLRFTFRWEKRLVLIGLPKPWIRKQVAIATLRATVLDPVNLALMLTLVGSWTVRWVVTH